MSHRTTKPTKWHVRPAKTQISLSIRPVWRESSLCAPRIAEDPRRLQADSEYSDQNGRMPRLTWVFAGRLSFCWFCHAAAHMYIQLTKSVITLSRGLVPEEDCGLWLWHYLDFFFFFHVCFFWEESKQRFVFHFYLPCHRKSAVCETDTFWPFTICYTSWPFTICYTAENEICVRIVIYTEMI